MDFAKLDTLRSILNKAGVSDREISNGIDLSEIGMAKLTSQLKMNEEDTKALINDLVNFLKKKDQLEESYKSLIDESDDEPEDSFHDEIHAKFGTYNFVWNHKTLSGTGTAKFSDKGVKIIAIYDKNGHQIMKYPDGDFVDDIQKQAIDFIKDV